MRSTGTRSVLLGAGEVARRLGVSKQTVYRLVRERELPAVRFGDTRGATVRFDPHAIEEWISEHATGGDA